MRFGLPYPFIVAGAASILTACAQHQDYHLIALAGQSNMDGRAPIGDLTDGDSYHADAMIRYLNPAWAGEGASVRADFCQTNGWVDVQPGLSVPPGSAPGGACGSDRFGPEIGFVRALGRASEHPVRLVKISEGGTNLRADWSPKRTGSLFHQLVAEIRAAEAETGERIDAVLWHQGEADAEWLSTGGDYRAELVTFLRALRQELGRPDLPVLIGEVFDNGRRHDGIRAAQRAVAGDDPYTVLVSSEGLSSQDPELHGGIHFDAASTLELGRRFADAYLQSGSRL